MCGLGGTKNKRVWCRRRVDPNNAEQGKELECKLAKEHQSQPIDGHDGLGPEPNNASSRL